MEAINILLSQTLWIYRVYGCHIRHRISEHCNTVFTTDETLLCRAEAYIHMKDYANAAKDLISWYDLHTIKGVKPLTEDYINAYYKTADKALRPELNPMFEIESDKQLNFMYCLLHFRRIETAHEGLSV